MGRINSKTLLLERSNGHPVLKIKQDDIPFVDRLGQHSTECKRKKAQGKRVDPKFEGPTLMGALNTVEKEFTEENFDSVNPEVLTLVKYHASCFLQLFYRSFQSLLDHTSVPRLDLCKDCDKSLQHLLENSSSVDENDYQLFYCYGEVVRPLKGIKYCTKPFSIYGLNLETEEPFLLLEQKRETKQYSSLFKAMFIVLLELREANQTGTGDAVAQLYQIANDIVSIGRIYQLFNYDVEAKQEVAKKSLAMLTAEDKGGPYYSKHKEFAKAFMRLKYHLELYGKLQKELRDPYKEREAKEIKRDIASIKYIKDLYNAIQSTKRFVESQFSDDDFYTSNKASSSENRDFKHLKSSILKSGFETDPFKGDPFDEVIGYKSAYEDEGSTVTKNTVITIIRTITINNPSKCKPRIIHISINAVQDRCNYIHRRLYAVITRLPSDCTKIQSKGIDFLKRATNLEYRQSHDMPAIYLGDFSNATDTLSMWFQEQCLGLIFRPEIVEFWHKLSTAKKVMLMPDGTQVPYEQKSGQPQGLLGSFDAFALAHHILMLLTMQLTKRCWMDPEEFYRVLGDDSAICTVTPDRNGLVLETYYDLCEWANFTINRDKTTIIDHTRENALGDFAKVTVLNGRIFTPTPVRLFFESWKSSGDAATIGEQIWVADHEGVVNRTYLQKYCRSFYEEESWDFVNALLFGDVIPQFHSISLEEVSSQLTDLDKLKIGFCFILNTIKCSVIYSTLGDRIKEALVVQDFTVEDGLEKFVTSSEKAREEFYRLLGEVNSDHKLVICVDKNLAIEDALNTILGFDSKPIAAGLDLSEDQIQTVLDIESIYQTILDLPAEAALSLNKVSSIIKDGLDAWDKFTYRSDYKKAALAACVAKSCYKTFKTLGWALSASIV